MSDESTEDNQTYRIGAVSRLTGVPSDTLRVWERRYSVVTPIRTDSGTRLYRPEDVGRIALIKRLVDRGDAISSVANLSLDQLQGRACGSDLAASPRGPERRCRVIVVGPTLAERVRRDPDILDGIEVLGVYDSRGALPETAPRDGAEVAVLEYPTIHADQIREIGNLLVHSGASRAVILYNYANRATLDRLGSRRILPLRGPLDAAELRRACLTLGPQREPEPGPSGESDADFSRPLPPRRFDDRELIRIAGASEAIRCECPRHLVDLVTALSAFETYSGECEIRSNDDAAVHAFLHAAAARARSTMETALARVVEAEGIGLTPGANPSESR